MLRKWAWRRKERAILRLVEGQAILDLGCGEGKIASLLQSNGYKVVGMDADAVACRKAKEANPNLQLIVASANQLPFKDGAFDCCLLSEILEHLPRPEKVLEESSRTLKDKGNIVIVVPNDFNFLLARLLTLHFKDAFAERGHVRSFSSGSLRRLVERCGRIIHAEGTPFKLPFRLCLLYFVKVKKRPILKQRGQDLHNVLP